MNTRLQRLLKKMPPDFEAALITSEVNRFYFLDFDAGDAGTLLLFPDEMVYIIDSRYIEIAREKIKNATVVLEEKAFTQVNSILEKRGVKNLYMENQISVAGYERVKSALPNVKCDISSTLSSVVDALRAIKDEVEIKRMQEAQRITDACFTHILPFIKEGVREVDLMLEMEHYMRSHRAQKVAFDTICVAGAKTSLPHGEPGENKVKSGDFITLDFGARFDGYCSDMTRTVAFGAPSEEQKQVYNTVLKAHLAGIQAARPHVKGCEVDKVARDIIADAGYQQYFGHGLGHAVGIEIHENPRFSPLNQDTILPGMVLTVEPGCYLPGKFGCRIEDMVLITESGCCPMPTSPKELIVL